MTRDIMGRSSHGWPVLWLGSLVPLLRVFRRVSTLLSLHLSPAVCGSRARAPPPRRREQKVMLGFAVLF